MINVPQEIIDATVGSSRSPFAKVWVAWDRSELAVDWFRLDEAKLDSQAMLTFTSYLEGESVSEIISEIDNFKYKDESSYVVSAEGLEELRGDQLQSVIAEADVVFDNTSGRFTPDIDKNLLNNPSFESDLDSWTLSAGVGGGGQLVGSGTGVVSGETAYRLSNPSSSVNNYLFSDSVEISSGMAYTGSVFARGTGQLLLSVVAVGSGGAVVDSGLQVITISSGAFQRKSVTFTIPTNATAAYLKVGTSSGALIVDDAQLERSSNMTSYNYDFIGDFLLPKRPVKIQINMLDKPEGTGGVVPKFAGLTENVEPSLRRGVTHLHILDFASELESKYVTDVGSGMGMYSNLPSHILIRELALKAGLTDSNLVLESGRQNIPFAWFREGSVWYYMQQIAEAEGGRVFFDEDGTLHFWNRDHADTVSYVSGVLHTFTFDDWVLDLDYRIDKNEIKNHIIVKSNLRELRDTQKVWSLQTPMEVPANSDITIWANINEIDGSDLPTQNIIEPVNPDLQDTDHPSIWIANDAADDSGTERSDNISLNSFSAFATSAKMVFHNNYPSPVFITEVTLYGQPAKISKEIHVEVENDASIDIYGRQTLQIENNYITSEDYALNVAQDKLFNLKDPKTKIRSQLIGVPYLQIGDLIRIEDGFQGDFRELFIRRNRWQLLADGEYIQDVLLESRTIASFFKLDQSTLDSTDVLAI